MKAIENNFDELKVNELLKKHFIELRSVSPAGSTHVLDIDGLKDNTIKFWSIWDKEDLIGCGAIKILSQNHGEFKSIRVHDKFREKGFGIVGLFDDDPKKINSQVAGLVIKPLTDLEKYCEKFNVAIGIIATPGEYAQGVADQLIGCGVRSILNFAPVLLKNVPDVQIRSVDLSQELQILSYYLDRPVLKAVD